MTEKQRTWKSKGVLISNKPFKECTQCSNRYTNGRKPDTCGTDDLTRGMRKNFIKPCIKKRLKKDRGDSPRSVRDEPVFRAWGDPS